MAVSVEAKRVANTPRNDPHLTTGVPQRLDDVVANAHPFDLMHAASVSDFRNRFPLRTSIENVYRFRLSLVLSSVGAYAGRMLSAVVPAVVVPKISPSRRRVSGAFLKAARASTGLTQDQLARILDVRVPTISERETGKDGVPWETWMATSMALGLPLDWAPPAPESPPEGNPPEIPEG